MIRGCILNKAKKEEENFLGLEEACISQKKFVPGRWASMQLGLWRHARPLLDRSEKRIIGTRDSDQSQKAKALASQSLKPT